MPAPDDDEREAGPLGSEADEPVDEGSGGAANGIAGPSSPPGGTEPDAS